jgi:cytochrome c5
VAAALGCGDASSDAAEEGSFTVLSQPAAEPEGPDPALWQTPLDDPMLEAGRVVWSGTCIDCHSTGLGGAPLIGNETLWAPRIEQGLDVLFEHATNGFYGKKGEMPARGGNADLTDADVQAAVRFMVSKVDPGVARGG